MKRNDLITIMSNKAGVTKKVADDVLSAFIETVQETVKNGDEVKLIGFGAFTSNERKARVGRNPKTNEEITIEAKRVPKFKVGKQFKDYVK